MRKYLVIVILFCTIIGGFFFYNKIDKITVSGCNYYSDDEIITQLGNGIAEKNSVLLYLKYRYIGIKEIPFIEKMTIQRVNNHEIAIRVYEKSLAACVKYMNQYLYFDKDGIVLDTSPEQLDGIPIVSGIGYSGFTLYEKLKVSNDEIFEHILDISQVIKQYMLNVDKVQFNTKKEVSLIAGEIKIYLGKRDFYDEQIVALSEILPKALGENRKGTINMVNYKSGDKVVFRIES